MHNYCSPVAAHHSGCACARCILIEEVVMGRFAHALARATATAVVVLFTGCDAADSVGPSARDAEDSPPALEARVDTMARLLATSMSREDVRQAVLAALRESPWVEHKIRLSDLFAGDDGRA